MNTYDPNYNQEKSYALVGQKVVIFNTLNKILLLKRSDKIGGEGKWSLPGGGIDRGEEPTYSITREIREETGLAVSELTPFYIKSYTNSEHDFVIIIGYTAKALSEEVVLNWEHDAYSWIDPSEALHFPLTSDAQTFLKHI